MVQFGASSYSKAVNPVVAPFNRVAVSRIQLYQSSKV